MYQLLAVLIGNRRSERPLSPYLRKRTGCGHSKRRPTLPIRMFVEALVENFLTSCVVSLYIDKQRPMDQRVNLLLLWTETMYAHLNFPLHSLLNSVCVIPPHTGDPEAKESEISILASHNVHDTSDFYI